MPSIGEKLILWYQQNKRPLPWRALRDPYAILISELMLQQTTVRVVIPYFERFLKRFPTLTSLARAQDDEVLSLWSGLGYYTRPRNLIKLARLVRHQLPQTYDQLLELPGVGPYTAAAVASIAFNEPVACVDGNVLRVITRLKSINQDISKPSTVADIRKLAQSLLTKNSPGTFNQAVMELGATICTPKNPSCLLCPIRQNCLSFKNQNQHLLPVKSKKKKQEPWLWQIILCSKNKKLALVKNSNGTPWLKNSWVLPGTAVKLKTKQPKKFHFTHSITHHRIFVFIKKKSPQKASKHWTWIDPSQVHKLGVSSVVHKVLNFTQDL
ncbi:MAG: A/G-specific adenine glycosylase [Oligoflexia bacterium]|nr:A/G-specific adenine glycosylase [Oligoflexia bacterium]